MRWILRGLVVGALVVLGLGVWLLSGSARTRMAGMEPEGQAEAFRHMVEFAPSRTVSRAGDIHRFPRRADALAGLEWEQAGATTDLEAFFESNRTQGMVVLHQGQLVYERYAEGAGPPTRFTSWSVAKSVTSTLVGLALGDGAIRSLDDPLERYVPELAGTAYEGVTVRQALQMSSGVRFTETYTQSGTSDVFRFMAYTLFGNLRRANAMAASFPRGAEPGTLFNYNTAETQILGWLVRSATGQSPSRYLQDKLWSRLGMEHDAAWLLDRVGLDGMEMTGCCLNMALRDWARFGQLVLQDGTWDGARLLPRGWVAEATRPGAEHLRFSNEGHAGGYGYQWWSFGEAGFAAEGVYGQWIFIDPRRDLVIAKASAWPDAWPPGYPEAALAAYAAIGAHLSGAPR